jgi:hypothetical protein
VPHADDTSPDPLKLPPDDLFGMTPFGDEPAAGAPDAPAAATDLQSVPDAPAETVLEPAGGKKKKREKKKKDRKEKKPAKAGASAKAPGPPLLTKISRASPYSVMLAVALGSLVIAVSALVLYLSNYDFKIHP